MSKMQRYMLYAIRACFVILALLFFVLILVDPNYHKWGGVFAGIGLPFLMPVAEKVFKTKIPFHIQLIYYIFLFVALDLGICMDWYRTVPYFDKIVHFGSGTISTIVGYYAISYFGATKTPYIFRILFVLSLSVLIAVLWEFFEFGCDKFLGQHMQTLVSSGVDDTMYDLLTATLGALIGCFCLVRPNKSKKSKK